MLNVISNWEILVFNNFAELSKHLKNIIFAIRMKKVCSSSFFLFFQFQLFAIFIISVGSLENSSNNGQVQLLLRYSTSCDGYRQIHPFSMQKCLIDMLSIMNHQLF